LVYDTNHIGVTLNFSSAHYQQDKSQIKNLKSLELFCQMTFATVSHFSESLHLVFNPNFAVAKFAFG
jgi:hypothetical protein